jgi:hypothetical protein
MATLSVANVLRKRHAINSTQQNPIFSSNGSNRVATIFAQRDKIVSDLS